MIRLAAIVMLFAGMWISSGCEASDPPHGDCASATAVCLYGRCEDGTNVDVERAAEIIGRCISNTPRPEDGGLCDDGMCVRGMMGMRCTGHADCDVFRCPLYPERADHGGRVVPRVSYSSQRRKYDE